jgi:TetR/AcrR family transcriptional repressor of nem operon
VTEASPAETGTIETGPNDTSPREASAARIGRRTRQRPGQDRRQALVEAAYRRIAECGFEGLRLRDVAAEVGIDHSTIHHYFPTKQALVTAVVDYATRQFWTNEPDAGTAAEELRRQLARLARMIVERPELHIVVRELDLRARRDAEVRAVVASREEGWRASLAELFASGAPAGAWAPAVDPALAGELVIAAVKGASLDPEHAVGALRQLELLLIKD